MLIGPIFFVSSIMGTILGLKSFVAAVIGGPGNVPGTIAEGLLLGVKEIIEMKTKRLILFLFVLLPMLLIAVFIQNIYYFHIFNLMIIYSHTKELTLAFPVHVQRLSSTARMIKQAFPLRLATSSTQRTGDSQICALNTSQTHQSHGRRVHHKTTLSCPEIPEYKGPAGFCPFPCALSVFSAGLLKRERGLNGRLFQACPACWSK